MSLTRAQDRLVTAIGEARSVVALTGAGISVPSGIPDFRSEGGLWTQYDPERIASVVGFGANAREFWEFYLATWHRLHLEYEPNAAHYALTALQEMGKLDAVITQNIDGLHQKAGNREVIEVHGTTRTWSCTLCGAVYHADEAATGLPVAEDGHRLCLKAECQQPVKPDVVLFGENLPAMPFRAASAYVAECDVLLCIGSSLTVYPVAEWPKRVHKNRAQKLAVISKGWTSYDTRAYAHLHGSADAELTAVVEALRN